MKRNARVLAAAMSLGLVGAAATGAVVMGKGDSDRSDWRKERIERMFERFDLNKDGAIDRDEADTAMDPFKRTDKDGDGKITLEELKAEAVARATARAERMYERLDANDDGVIDADEMAKMKERRGHRWRHRHGEFRGGEGHGPRHGGMWERHHGGPRGEDHAALADKM